MTRQQELGRPRERPVGEDRSRRSLDRYVSFPPLRFALVAAVGAIASWLGRAILTRTIDGELFHADRSGGIAVALTAWRILELALGWIGNYDALDMAALTAISHLPHLYLLFSFYSVPLTNVLAVLAIDMLSVALPVIALRPLSPNYRPGNAVGADWSILAYTVGLAATIYSLMLVWASRLFLPRLLVLHFAGVHTLGPAYTASYPALLPVAAFLGLATHTLVFFPSTATKTIVSTSPKQLFDPTTASLAETFTHTFWGYAPATKNLIRRTAAIAVVSAVHTYLMCRLTIVGVDQRGAAEYAALWTGTALTVGWALGMVARE